jgi:DNA repair exonuclease SbcCD ATPase subunit
MTLDLSLNNFRCWESKNLSIPSSGICLINGKSGKGKSTILNSILYAVTGKLKNITTITKKSTKVSLKIDNISITRSRGPNRLTVEKDGKIYENEEAQHVINSVFGLEFSNTSYIDQENIYSFVYLSPSEKIEFLEKLLLQNYDIEKIKENIRSEISKTKINFTAEESKLNTLENVLKNMNFINQTDIFIEKLKVTASNFQKTIEKVKSNYDICDKNIKTVKLKIKKLEEDQEKILKIEEKKANLSFLLKDIRSNQSYISEDLSSIEEKIRKLEKQKEYYIKNKENRLLHDKFEDLSQKYKKMNESNQKNQEYVKKELSNLYDYSSYSVAKKRLVELEKCIELIDTLFEIDQELQNLQNIDEELDKETKNYEITRDLLTKQQKILSDYEKCYTCPSCKKILKLNQNKLVSIDHIDHIDHKELQIEDLQIKVKESEKNISKLKAKQILYQQKEKQYNDIYDKLDSLRGSIECDKEAFSSEIEKLSIYIKKSEELELLKNDNLLNHCKSELDSISLKIQNIYGDNGNNLDNEENLIKNDQEYSNVLETISNLSQSKKIKLKEDTIENELKEILEKDKYCNYSELLSVEKEKLESYTKKYENYKSYIEKLSIWERINTDNEKYQEIEHTIKCANDTKQKLSERLRCLVKLREHVKDSEQKCILDFIESLNQHASLYIEEFFPDEDIKVELKTTQESKSTGKEKISLNFELNYRKISGDLSYLSGGERDRVNLAFTLAFSEIINNRILLLDECISSLDAETTNIVLENLKEKYKGKLVILVSHQANLGFFDKVIEL